MKNSQTIKIFQREGGGDITVDYNSGLITEKFKDENENDIEDKINVNSLTSQTWDQSKSSVNIKWREVPVGETEFIEQNRVMNIIKEPENIDPLSDHEFWYAQNLFRHIDSAVNLQYQF